jgi:MFS family permease
VTSGAGLIGAGIVVTSLVLMPSGPVLVAAIGWAVAGLGMGLAYSMLALVMLETSAPGEEGFSSAAIQLMFTLGTAFGAGIGGAIVALAAGDALGLAPAIGIVYGLMLVMALLTVGVSWRVPRGPSDVRAGVERPIPSAVPLEHP